VNDSTDHSSAPRRHWLTPRLRVRTGSRRGWAVLSLVMIIIIVLAATGDAGRMALRYQRDAVIHEHQYWRLLTGHLVHGSWQHVWLNLAGLGLVASLFRGSYSVMQWLAITLVSVAGIDAGFILLMPQLHWYVGLSGVLHGLLAAGAVAWCRSEDRGLAIALWSILFGKLAWERWHGALPLSGDLNVIVNAHLYGAVSGLLAGFILMKLQPPALHRT
jgi:rhomboid family GlyGly-CTERM serine protease